MSNQAQAPPVPAGGPAKPASGSRRPAGAATKPAPAQRPSAARTEPSGRPLDVSCGIRASAHKIVIYGPGGVGKSELASLLPIRPVFIDVEDGTNFLDVARIDPTPQSFEELRNAVRMLAEAPECGAIVVDSLTKAEEMALAHTLATVRHEKGHYVDSIEGYGFGKGYMHVYETFLLLMQDLDAAARAGKHIVGICHDCTANVPNPAGEDWIRYEPRLQSPPSGKGSIRHRVKEWCDHLLYVGFDTFVSTDGKAQGSGTRTIYPVELPTHWAKSRVLRDEIPYAHGDAKLWQQLFGE